MSPRNARNCSKRPRGWLKACWRSAFESFGAALFARGATVPTHVQRHRFSGPSAYSTESPSPDSQGFCSVSYTHLRAHETSAHL
eukprot:12852934-Alexandrium_andersonii.AAC.1